jgi:hypothetical protein
MFFCVYINNNQRKLRFREDLLYKLIYKGGSDISGTLSKLHHCIKKSYFSLILSRQTVSAGWPIIDKTKGHSPAKVNQLEAIRAGIVSGLRDGHTVKVIMSYGDFSKKTFFAMIIGSLSISRTTVERWC